jgi:hypothetical protein
MAGLHAEGYFLSALELHETFSHGCAVRHSKARGRGSRAQIKAMAAAHRTTTHIDRLREANQ